MKSPLRLELESGIDSLEVRRVSAHERMSQLFVADVLARSDDPHIDLDAIVGKGAGVAGEAPSGLLAWTGVCSYMEQVKPAQDLAGHSSYFLRIVPALWLLTQRRNHRIFQHQSTPDIVQKILAEFRIEPTLELTGEYARHEYCVQYGESDFAFVSRLLEQAGISYFFRRQKSGDKARSILVLADAPQRGESIGGIHYYDMPNEGQLEQPFITDVQLAHGVRTGKVTVRDFDFRKPRLSILDHSSFPLADGEKPEENYEQYHYLPGVSLFEVDSADDKLEMADDKSIARHLPKHNKAWAEREAEATRHQKRRVGFRSNQASLAPSKIFSVDHHPRTQLDDESLMVVEVDTFVSELEWAVMGTAVFAKTPYRPEARTPKPRIAGIQTAMVVGPPGREIHTDEFGRVRVRFHWDREGKYDDDATCWLRVSHAWAGTSFGTMHIPRVGQEVIVDFLDGDPDLPFIVGRVFNATTRVPRRLPQHKTQSIWRSATSPQTDGKFNEIMFDDAAGEELYFMQAERDLLRLTKRNDTERTGEDRTIVVGEGRVSAVAASDSLQVGKQHLIKMVKTGDLHISDMGDPDVQPLDTFVEMVDRKITLTTGSATIQLDGPNITIDAKGGLRFTTDGRLIMKGAKVYLNVMPGQVQPKTSVRLKDAVAKPDRMIGSVKELFWQPYVEELERREQQVRVVRLPVVPPQCAYVDGKSFNPEPPANVWDKVRRPWKVDANPRTEKVLFNRKEDIDASIPLEKRMQDAHVYEVTIGKQPGGFWEWLTGPSPQKVEVVVPASGQPPGANHFPTVNQLAKALAVLPPGQLKHITQVVAQPGLKHNDLPGDQFATVADAGPDGRVRFYAISPNPAQSDVDATMVHESAHTTAFAEFSEYDLLGRLTGTPSKVKATSDAWEKARAADGNFVSGYAESYFKEHHKSSEDYAESLVMYAASKGTECEAHARQRYPNRYKFLDEQMGASE